MSQLSFCHGWLLYAGNTGGKPDTGLAVAGDVLDFEISVQQGAVSVPPFGAPYATGTRTATVRAELAEAKLIQGKPVNTAMGKALQTWPDLDKGRAWPPQFRAMAELARRHPDEYRAILAAEKAAESLQVVRHSWLDGG